MFKGAKTTTVVTIMIFSIILSGCGLVGGKKEKIDPPQDVSYLKEEKLDVTTEEDESAQEAKKDTKIMTELFLIDKDGYVVPQMMALPETESVAKQAMQYLVENGEVSDLLPSGFRAVLPSDTVVNGVDVKDGKATVDFSPEFKNYQAENEEKILQAITWTLTQFDGIEKVGIKINGELLTEMPVNGTKIDPDGLTRSNGINTDASGVTDITNTRPVVVYYLAQQGKDYYYVPVTKRVSNTESNDITAVVNELIAGPSYQSNLVTEFLPEAKLLEDPVADDGKVLLNFNEHIFGSSEEKMISDYVLNSLALSLTELPEIEHIEVKVNGSAEIVNGKGEPITEPVSRPEKINAHSF